MLRLLLVVLTLALAPAIVFARLEPTDIPVASAWRPSEYVVQVYKQLGQRSPFTPNKTDNIAEVSRIIVELSDWTPPDFIIMNFPYYYAGQSYDNKPVWIVEMGRFDFNQLVRQGPEMIAAAEIAMEQALLRLLKSMDESRRDEETPRAQIIADLDGMNIGKFSHPQAFALLFRMAYRYVDVGIFGLEDAILINSNYFVETLVQLLKPVLGQLLERIEIYGSNKAKWMPRLQRLLPPSSLPPWYGGVENFKPIAAYG